MFLEPAFIHKLWGGDKLKNEFGYNIINDDKVGECWGVSAHPHGKSVVKNGILKGMDLGTLWDKHPEIFGYPKEDRFPLLVKLIDAKQDLSIQVHPDDEYAKANEEGSLGKCECWYVLQCDKNATIYLGHNASTKEQMQEMIKNCEWDKFLKEVPIKEGDFIQIEPGTLHSIKKGTVLLEIQQNSDITYRVYDFDRKINGKARKLHIKQCMDVLNVPSKDPEDFIIHAADLPDNQVNCLYSCRYYTIYKIEVRDRMTLATDAPYLIMSVITGFGKINGYDVKQGDHMIIPNGVNELELEGNFDVITTRI